MHLAFEGEPLLVSAAFQIYNRHQRSSVSPTWWTGWIDVFSFLPLIRVPNRYPVVTSATRGSPACIHLWQDHGSRSFQPMLWFFPVTRFSLQLRDVMNNIKTVVLEVTSCCKTMDVCFNNIFTIIDCFDEIVIHWFHHSCTVRFRSIHPNDETLTIHPFLRLAHHFHH